MDRWNILFKLGRAQHSALTKNIRDWDITAIRFPSSSEGIRNVVLAPCCERLLSNYLDFNCSTSSRTMAIKKIGRGCLYSEIVSIVFPLFALGLVTKRRDGVGHGSHGPFAFCGGGGQQC